MLFVHEGIAGKSPWHDLKGQMFLGDEDFVEEVVSSRKVTSKEICRGQRYADRPQLAALLPAGAPMKKAERDRLATEAHLSYGYTLKEIAGHLHLHWH